MSGDLREGIVSSSGDPRLLLALNVVLSATFAYVVLWLSAVAGLAAFTWGRFAAFTLLLMALPFAVTRE